MALPSCHTCHCHLLREIFAVHSYLFKVCLYSHHSISCNSILFIRFLLLEILLFVRLFITHLLSKMWTSCLADCGQQEVEYEQFPYFTPKIWNSFNYIRNLWTILRVKRDAYLLFVTLAGCTQVLKPQHCIHPIASLKFV